MSELLKSALGYHIRGCSVIPIRHNKVSYIQWQPYQNQIADEKQIKEWWDKWPEANIGVVTGKISNIMVVDVDSDEGHEDFLKYVDKDLVTPTAKTPGGGWHYWFKYREGLINKARVLVDCDIRTDGGYVIAPPSKNGNGSYEWVHKGKVNISSMNNILFNKLSSNNNINNNTSTYNNIIKPEDISFQEGYRDQTLFHLAVRMARGGADADEIRNYLYPIAQICDPPFPEKEIETKIQSALSRRNMRDVSLSDEIMDFVLSSDGLFLSSDVFNCLQLSSRQEKKNCSTVLSRLLKKGVIERAGKRNGQFRKVKRDINKMNYKDVSVDALDIWLPFNVHKLLAVEPGNICVVAGETNSGKTALLLNIIRCNQKDYKIHYFNSEMGPSELKRRLLKFDDMTIDMWNFDAYERSSDFADVIKSGRGNINVIDYLEMYDNFFEIGGKIAEIHDKLDGAIAFIAIQKNKGRDAGLGGERSMEKARLYFSMSPGKFKIVKGKNWLTERNYQNKQVDFKLAGGCNFVLQRDWYWEGQ